MLRNKFYDSLKKILFAFVATMFVAPAFSATLPAGYTQLEYIQSSGTQYIDTEVVPNQNSKMILDAQLTESSGGEILAGSRVAFNSRGFTIVGHSGGTKWAAGYGDESGVSELNTELTRHTFEVSANGFFIDNTKVFTYTTQTFTTPGNLVIGAVNNNGTIKLYSKAKFYSFKFYNNDTLVRDFVPAQTVINGETVNGMYDTVGNQFYRSAASGTNFTAGPATCRNLFNPATVTTGTYISSAGVETSDIRYGHSDYIPVSSGETYIKSNISGNSVAFYNSSKTFVERKSLTSFTATYDGYVIINYVINDTDMQFEQGGTATAYAPYCQSDAIKIATTKYNEDAFANLVTTLNSAITKVTNIVDTTVAQASSIGTLATTKQDRPADGDCPAGRKCLLVTGTDGKPHWYLIQE